MPSKAVVAFVVVMICTSAGHRVLLQDSNSLIDRPEISRLNAERNRNIFAEPVMEGFRFVREVVHSPQEADGELKDRPRRTIDLNLMNIFGGQGSNDGSRNGGGLFQKNDASRNEGSGNILFGNIFAKRNRTDRNRSSSVGDSSNERFPFKNSRSSNNRSLKDRLSERRSSNNDAPSEFTKLIRKFSHRGNDTSPRTSSILTSLNMNNRFFSKDRFSFRNRTFLKNRSSRERETGFGRKEGLEGILQSIFSMLFNKPDNSESDDSRRTGLKSLLRPETRNNLHPNRGFKQDRIESIELPEKPSRTTEGTSENRDEGFLTKLLATILMQIMTIFDPMT